MRVVLIGGMQRLKRNYREIFEEFGMSAEVFDRWRGNMEEKLKGADLIIILTSLVSTNMARKAVSVAHSSGVPVVRIHKHSVSSLKKCLTGLGKEVPLERCRRCDRRYSCETYGYRIMTIENRED